jgi:hypothetical protein
VGSACIDVGTSDASVRTGDVGPDESAGKDVGSSESGVRTGDVGPDESACKDVGPSGVRTGDVGPDGGDAIVRSREQQLSLSPMMRCANFMSHGRV